MDAQACRLISSVRSHLFLLRENEQRQISFVGNMMATSATVNKPVETTSAAQGPNPMQLVLQASSGYMVSAAMYAVTKLSIADLLADGPQPISALASKTGMNEDALYRVLRALTCVGVFEESPARTFSLNPAANYLRADVPGSLRCWVLWLANKLHFDVWSEILHSIQTGVPAVEHVYQQPCFEVLSNGQEHCDEFNNAMTNFSAMTMPCVLEAYDFSGVGTLVDIAGGHGFLLCNIVKQYPAMKGILFEMESVAAQAKEHVAREGVSDRVRIVSGSFFETAPEGGDVYMMQHIIHDWADDKALAILNNVHRAMKGKGKLLVLDSIVKPGVAGDFTPWKDLEMLVLPGGRERTESEFRDLLARGGFRLQRVIPTQSTISILESVPV